MNNSLLKPFNQQYCLSVSGFCVTHGHNAVKNRITMQAADAASLVPYDPRKEIEIFNEIFQAISCSKYHRPNPEGSYSSEPHTDFSSGVRRHVSF